MRRNTLIQPSPKLPLSFYSLQFHRSGMLPSFRLRLTPFSEQLAGSITANRSPTKVIGLNHDATTGQKQWPAAHRRAKVKLEHAKRNELNCCICSNWLSVSGAMFETYSWIPRFSQTFVCWHGGQIGINAARKGIKPLSAFGP